MRGRLLLSVLSVVLAAAVDCRASNVVTRLFRPPRWTKGNTGMQDYAPIDRAKWLWHPAVENGRDVPKEGVFLRFRRAFEKIGGEKLRFDVCADERYVLKLDGKVISRGPNRGDVNHWLFQSYEVDLSPGEHVLDALVWRLGEEAPLAQRSWRGGFALKAEGAYHRTLSTGYFGDWQTGRVTGTRPRAADAARKDAFGVGCCFDVHGTRADLEEPASWTGTIRTDAWVRRPLWPGHGDGGTRETGWQLFPCEREDQVERFFAPGAFKAVKAGAFDDTALFTEAEARDARVAAFDALLKEGRPLTVPPNTVLTALWDLGVYRSGYPDLGVNGGKGAEVRWGWAESLGTPTEKRFVKGDRAAFAGKAFRGLTDAFFPDGRADATFGIPWWRCGRWCRLEIRTGDAPLELVRLGIVESRAVLEDESAFECDDPTIPAIKEICARGMQMCAHETLFDCPYYEQQMYPGDTRTQLMTLTAMSRDDRLVRMAIETYDWARLSDGLVPFSFPTQDFQEGATYTMCWLCMLGDYAYWQANAAWLKARVPGMRHTLHGLALYEGADGLVKNLPGWCFMDWVPEWTEKRNGCAPDGPTASANPSAVNNLLYLNALRSAVRTEEAAGDAAMAAYWRAKAEKLAAAIRATFWDARRGLVADTVAKDRFSEHAQALAILGDALPAADAARAFEGLVTAADLDRCTVYFSYYLFEAYFKFGRGDLFLKRLDLWRHYVKMNLTTPLEAPGDSARSDCHAWGSHPLYFLQAGVAGIRPAAPGFARVRVHPSPGGLHFVKAKVPHPNGFVTVDMTFARGEAHGTVTTPVPGVFEWKDRKVELKPGLNAL